MNRKTFIIGTMLGAAAVLGLVVRMSLSADLPYSLSPRQTGVEILEELIVRPNTITIKVGSNGCTDKSSFRVDVKMEDGITAKTPHYILTIHRVRPDECKAFLPEGVAITFDLEKDLGLRGNYTLSVANMVFSRSES